MFSQRQHNPSFFMEGKHSRNVGSESHLGTFELPKHLEIIKFRANDMFLNLPR